MKKKLIASITVTMFLVTLITFGLPAQVSAYVPPDVEIGIIGPHGWIQWDGLWEAAQLARDVLNDNGGIIDKDGFGHEVVIYAIDEHAVPTPDPAAAVTELLTVLTDNPGIETLVGGFRSECVFPMREACMDFAAANNRPIWNIAGAATDELISDIQTNYPRYKYMFRATPMNGTTLFMQILGLVAGYIQPKLSAIFGTPLNTIIVAEDLVWADGLVSGLEYYLGVVYGALFNLAPTIRAGPTETDFSGTFSTIQAANAKLVIHIFSAVAGASFINYHGATNQPQACMGINVESQTVEFYEGIGGNCEYEAFLASVGTVQGRDYAVNPAAKPWTTKKFWEEYYKAYKHGPIYTAWGCFDTIIALNETADQWMDMTMDERIELQETTERAGMLGVFKYTGPNGKDHDMFCEMSCMSPYQPPVPGYGMLGRVRSWIPQWYKGELEVVFPVAYAPAGVIPGDPALPFGRKYRVSPSMYVLAESDWVTDGLVDVGDMSPIQARYGTACPWTLLGADMDNNNYLDIDDATRVALDWGKNATKIYGQWPLP